MLARERFGLEEDCSVAKGWKRPNLEECGLSMV